MISNEAPRARANARLGRAAAWPYRRSTGRSCHQLSSDLGWVTTSQRASVSPPINQRQQLYWSPRALPALMVSVLGQQCVASSTPRQSSTAQKHLQFCWARDGSGRPPLLKTMSLSPVTKSESQTFQSTLSPTTNPKKEDEGVSM